DDIKPALHGNVLWTAGDASIAIQKEEHSPSVTFDLQSGHGCVDCDQRQGRASIDQPDLPSLGDDDLGGVIAEVYDRAAIAESFVRIHLARARAVEVHDPDLVGTAIVRVGDHRAVAAESGGGAVVRSFV